MRRRSLTWLGVAVIAAILVATAIATAAAVRDGHREARATRARVAEPAIRGLASDVSQAGSTLDDLRSFFEASDDVAELGFRRFAAGPLARQASLQYLAWNPLAGGPAFRETRAGAPAGLPSLAAARGELDAARDDAVPRMTAPLTTPGGVRGCSWWRRSTRRGRRSAPWRSGGAR